MKTELPCAVVRDLLPSYAEQLTEEETSRLLQTHLERCPDCRSRYEAMTEDKAAGPSEQQQIDYLKKVRRTTGKRILCSVLVTILVVFLAVSTWLFVIGSPADPEAVHCAGVLRADGKTAEFTLTQTGSALSLTGIRVEQEGTLVTLKAREVLSSVLFPSGSQRVVVSLEGVEQISFMGMPVWQQEILLSRRANRLWEARTASTGSASDLGRLAERLYLPSKPFKNVLQTDHVPYGWTWEFQEPLTEAEQEELNRLMAVPLALVQNLGEMTWSDPAGHTHTLTLADVDAALPDLTAACNEARGTDWQPMSSVKDYAVSVYRTQLLLELLGIE